MKFVGSKNRIAKDIVPIIQNAIDISNPDMYIEPFVGGANIIDKINHNNKIGYDNNYYLISMWNALKNGWNIPGRPTRDEYWDVKENKEKYPPEWVAIVGFVSTYNAKWFDGYANITKTKTGKIRDYYDEGKRNIEKQIPNILDIDFRHESFEKLNFKNSVIYCDPPYITKNTRKDLYGNIFNHEEYYNWLEEQSNNNIIIASEYYMPDNFICIYEKGLQLHFDNRQKDKRIERLFIHKNNSVICPNCNLGYLVPNTNNIKYNSYCNHCNSFSMDSWCK